MSILRHTRACLIAPALAVFLAGCGGDKTGGDKPTGPGKATYDNKSQSERKGAEGVAKSTTSGGDKTPVEGKGTATLKGKVVYDGTPPAISDVKIPAGVTVEEHCKKGDMKDQTWQFGADKGVANVVVFLKAPDGKFFQVPDDQKKRTDTVSIDQPFCQFVPHVVAVFPSYYDPATKKQTPTGQTFKVLNSAPIPHNTAWQGRDLLNPSENKTIKSKDELVVKVKPCADSKVGEADLVRINCDVHKWMTARAAVFDHPYFAVTDKDGNFEIKGIPAGTPVTVAYWHESMGNGNSLNDAKSESKTLTEGENKIEFKVK